MIAFTQPWYLFFLLIAAGPIVLHLLNRRRMHRIEFSSLFFLRKLRERRFRWLKLRDVLLLILRTLFLVFGVLALAGPVWRGRFPLGKMKAHVVIILDDSYSTEARFGDLRLTALRVLDELSPGSRVALLTPSGRVWDSLWEEPAVFRERIEELEASGSGRSLKASWDAALRLAEGSKASTRRLVIISDGQEHAVDFLKAKRIPEDIEVYCFLDERSSPDNSSITDVELYPAVPLPQQEHRVRIGVRRAGKREEGRLSLFVDERMVEERRINLSEGRQEIEFRLPQGAGEVRVVLDSDSITADDQRFLLAAGGRLLRVALVGDETSEFLELALRVGSGIDVQRVTPSAAAGLSALSCDLLIWDGATSCPPQVRAAARQGLPVLVLLNGEVEDVEHAFDFLGTSSSEGFEILAASSLFADLKEGDRRQIHITRYVRLRPAGGQVILSLSGGDPLMLADTSESIYYLATRFTPRNTNLVYRALFPAMMQRIAGYVAGESFQSERLIGDTLRVRVSGGKALFVETPRLHYEITPRRADGAYVVQFTHTADGGFYRIGQETFVVNPDPKEASSVKINPSELEKRGIEVYPLGSSTPRKLWLYALILAAACLAVEFLFIFL